MHTTQGQPQIVPRQSNLEPEQCRQGKHTRRERGQTQCGRDTASTRQCYLFAASLPPHSTTEQVSLKKCPPPPPCARAEIRHWRDQQTEEAKTNWGNHVGSDRCNRLRPCSYYRLHRKRPIDLEKHKPDKRTTQKLTDPTLPTTTPEKVLDIFVLLSFFKLKRNFFYF